MFSSELQKFQLIDGDLKKENFLLNMFHSIFVSQQPSPLSQSDHSQFKDAFELSVSKQYLDLLYKFIWFKLKRPDIEKIGKSFFFEVTDSVEY